MKRDDATAEGPKAESPGGGGTPAQWPLYVRVLAVAYVLSHVVQWVAFILLAGTAAFLYGLGHSLDGVVVGLGLGGFACVAACHAFRWWFPRWGRRHYPPPAGCEGPDDAPRQAAG